MLGRKALFPGRDYLHQLRLIIDVLGTPSDEDLASIANAQAVQFLRTLPPKPKKPWSEVFPNAAPAALELLGRMLVFDPAKRCSMEDALLCDYMAPLHQGRPLPTVDKHFSFLFEKPGIKQASADGTCAPAFPRARARPPRSSSSLPASSRPSCAMRSGRRCYTSTRRRPQSERAAAPP